MGIILAVTANPPEDLDSSASSPIQLLPPASPPNAIHVEPESLENFQKILNINGKSLILKSFECLPGSRSGDNYMSVIKRITITGVSSDNHEDLVHLSLIVKRQIPNKTRRLLYRCDEAFQNEINAYNYVVPMLTKRRKDCLPYPKCHFAGRDESGELIVLEDLKRSGYKMENRLNGLEFEQCQLVMQELASSHAASIFAKHTDSQVFVKHRQTIREIVYCHEADEFYRSVVRSSIREALNSLRLSNKDGSLSEPIRLIENLEVHLYDIVKNFITDDSEAFNVICHGDLWVNNLMFKSDSKGRSHSVKFVDLQAMRYSSPVADILHLIYTSTKRKTRDCHLEEILNTYSTCLLSNLSDCFGPDNLGRLEELNKIYNLESITKQFYSNVLYGLVVCMWVLPAVTFAPDNILNLDEVTLDDLKTNAQEINISQKLTPEYHTRMKDIALEFYQNGFLTLKRN